MRNKISISLVQFNALWQQTEENLTQLSKKLTNITSDIIVLPEMFATGFSMNVEKVAQTEQQSIATWMKELSKQKKCAICGSVAIKEDNYYYNRFFFVFDGLIVATYNKRHLFTYGKEHLHYTKGNKKIIFDYQGWKICPMICYDLRFPVWNRNTENYDILLNVANWPTTRIENWKILNQARAIENICYVIAVNRTGNDGNNLQYNGQSQAFSPLGKSLIEKEYQQNEIITIELQKETVNKIREEFPFLEDKDSYTILL